MYTMPPAYVYHHSMHMYSAVRLPHPPLAPQ